MAWVIEPISESAGRSLSLFVWLLGGSCLHLGLSVGTLILPSLFASVEQLVSQGLHLHGLSLCVLFACLLLVESATCVCLVFNLCVIFSLSGAGMRFRVVS